MLKNGLRVMVEVRVRGRVRVKVQGEIYGLRVTGYESGFE